MLLFPPFPPHPGGTLWPTSGAPASTLGQNGDYAADTTLAVLYGPKAGGAWPAGIPLQGIYVPAKGGSVAFAISSALPASTYANGTAGVGATITGNANAALSSTVCDGVTPTVGMRCWIWDYTRASGGSASYGIYTVTQVGSGSAPFILTRATDANTAAALGYVSAFVVGGSANVNLTIGIPLAASAITVGTTALDPGVVPTVNVAAVAAASTAADRAARTIAAVTEAAGTAGAVKLLVTGDGAKTYRGGTTVGEIQTLAPLIGPGGNLVQPANAWSPGSYGVASGGLPVMPILNADNSLKFHGETGFVLAAAIPSQFSLFAIDMIVAFPAVAATFASRALAAADTTLFTDAILATSGEGFTTSSPDLPLLKYRACGVYQGAELVDGLYRKNYNGGAIAYGQIKPMLTIGDISSLGSAYFQLFIDQRGQILVQGYDGTHQPSVRSYCTNVFANAAGGKAHIHVYGDGTYIGLRINGQDLGSWKGVFSTVPDHIWINGSAGANTLNPVNGWPYSLYAFCVSEGLSFPARRRVHDALASIFGTRPLDHSDKMYGYILMEQSQGAGATVTTSDTADNPDSDTGWNGMVVEVGNTNGSCSSVFTQTALPRSYYFRGPTLSIDIGPIDINLNIYGVPTGARSISGGDAETMEWGLDYWLRQVPELQNADICYFGVCFGGYGFTQLTERSLPPLFPPALRDYDLPAITAGAGGSVAQNDSPVELLERQLLAAKDLAASRGQTFEIIVLNYSQGETIYTETSNYGSELAGFFASEIANIQALTGQSRVPICFSKEICLKTTATSPLENTMMIAPYYYQNQRRLLAADQNTPTVTNNVVSSGPSTNLLPMYNGLCDYSYGGAWIHKPSILYRRRGEGQGWFLWALMTGVAPRNLSVLSLSVATAATANINVGDLVLKLNQAAQFVATQLPNVTRTIVTPPSGGSPVNTYGLVLVPATVTAGSFVNGATYTIASVGTTNFTAIGASANTVGVSFTATGAGSGTGTATASATIASVFFKTGDATTLVVRLSRAGIKTAAPTVGDAVTATGIGAYFTNIKATATVAGHYPDLDWADGFANLQTVGGLAGYCPFVESTTQNNDLTPFLASGLYQF